MAGLNKRAGLAIAAALSGAAAWAQDNGGDAAGRTLQPLVACRAIADPAVRLACYDKATVALEEQVRGGQVKIVDRQEIRKAKRSLFGFTLPRIDLFGGGRGDRDEAEEFTQLDTTIVSVTPVANGRMQLHVAEGDAVWVTTDPMNFPPRTGAKVRIRKGALGNYFISISGERSVRGMRVH